MIKLIVLFIIIILIIVCLNKYSKENFFIIKGINRAKCKAFTQRKFDSCRQGVWPCCNHGNDIPDARDWDTHMNGNCIKACDNVYNKYDSDNACIVRGNTSIGLPLYPSDGESWKSCIDETIVPIGAGSGLNLYKLPSPITCTYKNKELDKVDQVLKEGEKGFKECVRRGTKLISLLHPGADARGFSSPRYQELLTCKKEEAAAQINDGSNINSKQIDDICERRVIDSAGGSYQNPYARIDDQTAKNMCRILSKCLSRPSGRVWIRRVRKSQRALRPCWSTRTNQWN